MAPTFFNDPEDMLWLYETHLPATTPRVFRSAMLYGNLDAPEQIHLFLCAEPHYDEVADSIYLDDGGDRLACEEESNAADVDFWQREGQP